MLLFGDRLYFLDKCSAHDPSNPKWSLPSYNHAFHFFNHLSLAKSHFLSFNRKLIQRPRVEKVWLNQHLEFNIWTFYHEYMITFFAIAQCIYNLKDSRIWGSNLTKHDIKGHIRSPVSKEQTPWTNKQGTQRGVWQWRSSRRSIFSFLLRVISLIMIWHFVTHKTSALPKDA